jgi:gallate dioxygenase
MARIIGGIGSSHSPTIGFAFDTQKQNDPVWAPIFEGYKPIREWLAEKKPDVLFIIYNDHVSSFFFDHYSNFALGIGDYYTTADEGGGPRRLPAVKGHIGLSHHVAAALVADEFDMSFFQDRPLDHGCFSPLSMLLPHEPGWPAAIVPLQVGVLQFPIPSGLRCYKLGQSLRRAIESYPEDISVVVVGTGGLSHQVHGERAGFNNTEWDMQFLDLIEKDPMKLTELRHADYAKLGGLESAESIMWLVMRGALSSNVKKIHQSYYLPSMTALATVLYENEATTVPVETGKAYLDNVGRQLKGVEQLDGTYPFTLPNSVKTYRLNKFLHRLTVPAFRESFLADQESCFEEACLSSEERDLVRRRDWRGLIHYGVIFFLLEKLGAVLGISSLHIYASMRGQTLEEFLKSRNTQVQYSVSAEAQNISWEHSST